MYRDKLFSFFQGCLSKETSTENKNEIGEKWLKFSVASQNLEFSRLKQSEGYDPSVLNYEREILSKSLDDLVKIGELNALETVVEVKTAKSRGDWFAALTGSISMVELAEKYGAFSLKHMLGLEELAYVINFNPSGKHKINLHLPPKLLQNVEADLRRNGFLVL